MNDGRCLRAAGVWLAVVCALFALCSVGPATAQNDTLVSVVNGTEYLNVTQLLSNETINTSNETTSNSTDYSWLQCAVTVYNGTNLTGNAWVIDPNVTVWFNDTNAEAPNATIYYALWNFRTPRVKQEANWTVYRNIRSFTLTCLCGNAPCANLTQYLELRMYELAFRDQPVNNPYDDFVFDNATDCTDRVCSASWGNLTTDGPRYAALAILINYPDFEPIDALPAFNYSPPTGGNSTYRPPPPFGVNTTDYNIPLNQTRNGTVITNATIGVLNVNGTLLIVNGTNTTVETNPPPASFPVSTPPPSGAGPSAGAGSESAPSPTPTPAPTASPTPTASPSSSPPPPSSLLPRDQVSSPPPAPATQIPVDGGVPIGTPINTPIGEEYSYAEYSATSGPETPGVSNPSSPVTSPTAGAPTGSGTNTGRRLLGRHHNRKSKTSHRRQLKSGLKARHHTGQHKAHAKRARN